MEKNKPMIVAFIGPKGCGKSTACQTLMEEHPDGKILTFAGELKRLCKDAFRLRDEQVYGNHKDVPFPSPVHLREKELRLIAKAMDDKLHSINKKHPFSWMKIAMNKFPINKSFHTPREILQWIGTEYIHTIYLPFHCEVLAGEIKDANCFFVDDLRFVNEYEFLKNICPWLKTVKITGRGEKPKGLEEHSSESDWKNIEVDYKLDNDKSIESFRKNVVKLYGEMIKDVEKELSKKPDMKMVLDNILGEEDEPIGENEIRVGNAVFKRQSK